MTTIQLRAWRLHKGLNQSELARRAGLHQLSVHYLENGRRGQHPRSETKEKLAKALGISVLELAGYPPKEGTWATRD